MWTEAPTAASFHFISGHFADLGKSVAAGFGRGNGSVFGSSIGEPFVAILENEQPLINIPAASSTLGPAAK